LPELINYMVQRGKMQSYGTSPDTDNNGTDNKTVQYHTAIQNPNSNSEPQQ
jgi:hypothetical protein